MRQRVATMLIMNINVKVNDLSIIPKWNLYLQKFEASVF